MALVTFYQIFRVIDSNTLAFINRTRVGITVFEPNAVITRGQIIAGLDFFSFIGKNMEVTAEADGTQNIERVYV